MYNSLKHTSWECKYDVIFITKYRKHIIYGQIKNNLGSLFRELAKHKESLIEECHLCTDHVHMLISIPPKYSVAQVVGYIKGKSAIYISRNFFGRTKNYNGQKFWARGYFVSTVGRDETIIREYIKKQNGEDKKLEQLDFFKYSN